MEIKTVLFYLAIVVALYAVYLLFFANNNDTTLTGIANAKGSNIISATNFKPGNSSDYTFSIWAYVNDWNYRFGEEKVMFSRTNQDNSPSPAVSLGSNNNDLNVHIGYYGNGDGNTTSVEQFTCRIENIPLQRWTHYIVVVNGRSLDVYVDGKLVKTCVIPGVPFLDNGSNVAVTPDGGFSGYTAKLRYINYAINPATAYSIYKEGYGSSNPLGNYKMRFTLSENEEVKVNYEI